MRSSLSAAPTKAAKLLDDGLYTRFQRIKEDEYLPEDIGTLASGDTDPYCDVDNALQEIYNISSNCAAIMCGMAIAARLCPDTVFEGDAFPIYCETDANDVTIIGIPYRESLPWSEPESDPLQSIEKETFRTVLARTVHEVYGIDEKTVSNAIGDQLATWC